MAWTKVVALATALVLALLAPAGEAAAVNGPIIVRGNKMYNSKTGERFFLKGVR